MKNKKVFLAIIILSGLVLVMGFKFIYMGIHKDSFEIVKSNNSNNINNKEISSVVEVIKDQQYQKINRLTSDDKTAYIIVDDKNINEQNIDMLLNLSNEMNLKLTFINDNEYIGNNDKIEYSGNTVIPKELDLNELIKNNKLKSFDLSQEPRANELDKKSVVLMVHDMKSLGENNTILKNEVKSLKDSGYTFKALA